MCQFSGVQFLFPEATTAVVSYRAFPDILDMYNHICILFFFFAAPHGM